MRTELYTKDVENRPEKTETLDATRNTPCRDVLDATEITIEEVSIDGICGVY
jgi:mycofactocin precursor